MSSFLPYSFNIKPSRAGSFWNGGSWVRRAEQMGKIEMLDAVGWVAQSLDLQRGTNALSELYYALSHTSFTAGRDKAKNKFRSRWVLSR